MRIYLGAGKSIRTVGRSVFVYAPRMTEPDWTEASAPAALIQALQAHRLLPVAGLLAERSLLRGDLVKVAEQMTARAAEDERRRVAIETEVLGAITAAGIEVLVLKGALLARTVYPMPEARIRTDIDLLVPADSLAGLRATLRQIGFAPSYEVHGGPPMTQAQWVRRGERPLHAVDVHWDLFNLPLLKNRFDFDSLAARSMALPGMGPDVRGLSPADALLHACAHYFGHHGGEFRPDQWLLDMDLLWRAMDADTRAEAEALARDCGVLSLLGSGLGLAAARFGTPVAPADLARFTADGAGERSARLIRPVRFARLAMLRSAFDEQGAGARVRHLWRLAFPPATYMRTKYPEARGWMLPWLYVRRVWEGRR
jgi:hypothetical protein